MEMTLEKELRVRINQHKMTMLMARIAKQYIAEQSKGELQIPMHVLEEQAVQVAQAKTSRIMLAGKLEEGYNEAWEALKEVIPDNYCTLQ
jgi:hypothetical protein